MKSQLYSIEIEVHTINGEFFPLQKLIRTTKKTLFFPIRRKKTVEIHKIYCVQKIIENLQKHSNCFEDALCCPLAIHSPFSIKLYRREREWKNGK